MRFSPAPHMDGGAFGSPDQSASRLVGFEITDGFYSSTSGLHRRHADGKSALKLCPAEAVCRPLVLSPPERRHTGRIPRQFAIERSVKRDLIRLRCGSTR